MRVEPTRDPHVLTRFYLYSILKNSRFGEAFLVLYLRELGHSFALIGLVLGAQHMVTALLELPLGVAADRWGRRMSLAAGFLFYVVAFGGFALLPRIGVAGLWATVALFSVAEALRTGSHKAIILDYLDGRGESDRATSVIGRTRMASKSTSALAGLIGGLMLYATGSYPPLYAASAVAALGGFFLMLSYPRALEGEQRRERERQPGATEPSLLQRARKLFSRPGFGRLLLQSALFEVQVKASSKYYLQPLMQQGLAGFGLPVPGVGAVWIGATEAARDGLGAVGARGSTGLERRVGGGLRALRLAYVAALVLALGVAWTARNDLMVGVVAMLLAMTYLQNARRPVFISVFNGRVDQAQRATGLSLESLVRNALLTVLLPVTGALADAFGLWAAFALTFALLLPGVLLLRAPVGATK